MEQSGVQWRAMESSVVVGRTPRSEREVGACSSAPTRPRLDEKGRLFLPAKFRDELAEAW